MQVETGNVQTDPDNNSPTEVETESTNNLPVESNSVQTDVPSVAGFYTIRARESDYVCTGGPPLNDPYGPSADNVIVTQSNNSIEIEYENFVTLAGSIDSGGIFEATGIAPPIGDVTQQFDLAGAIEDNGFWSGQLTVTLTAPFNYICTANPFFDGQRGELITEPSAPIAPTPGECIDTPPLNDGFGWNGVETCTLPIAMGLFVGWVARPLLTSVRVKCVKIRVIFYLRFGRISARQLIESSFDNLNTRLKH